MDELKNDLLRLSSISHPTKGNLYQKRILQLLLSNKALELAADECRKVQEKERREAKEREGKLAREAIDSQVKLQNIQGQLDSLDIQLKLALKRNMEREGLHELQEERLASQESTISALKEQISQHQLQRNKLKEQGEKHKQALTQSLSQLNQIKQISKRAAQTEGQLRLSLKQASEAEAEQRKSCDQQKRSLNERIAQLQVSLTTLTAQSNGALLQRNKRIQELDARCQSSLRQASQVKQSVHDCRVELERSQTERENSLSQLRKVQKELKKERECCRVAVDRETELQAELSSTAEKLKTSERNLKTARKEIDQLKEELSGAEESHGDWAAKVKKHQGVVKGLKDQLKSLEEELEIAKEQTRKITIAKEQIERKLMEETLNADRLRKDKAMLSQTNLRLEERRILTESEREKAIDILVREKQAVLQLNEQIMNVLEIKDRVIERILNQTQEKHEGCLKELWDKLGGEKLKDARERVRVIGQFLKK